MGCSFLDRQGLLSTERDAAMCDIRQCSHTGKPLGKRAATPQTHDILTRRKVLLIFIATALPLPCEVFGICDCLHLVSTEKHVVLNWWLIRKGLRLDTYFIYYYFNFIHFLYLFSRNREDVPEDATTTVLKRQGLLVAGTPCASWSNGATPGRMNIKGSISFHLPCLLLFLQVYL